jgi:hypothetical protein
MGICTYSTVFLLKHYNSGGMHWQKNSTELLLQYVMSRVIEVLKGDTDASILDGVKIVQI